MLKQERQLQILEKLQAQKKVLSATLSEELEVSEDTIRRDLTELANEGKLLKVHGGALTTSQHVYTFREEDIYDREKKIKIARKALNLIRNNDAVIIGGGTTNLELVDIFPTDLGVTVFTYSLPIAMRLSDHPKVEVILFGGKVMKGPQITLDPEILEKVKSIRADACFLSASGVDADKGLMEINWEVSQLKRAITEVSDSVVVMATADKINTKQQYLVCKPSEIDHLITDMEDQADELKKFSKKGIEIL